MFKGKVTFVVVVFAWAMMTLGCTPQSSIDIAANKHNKEERILLLGIKFTPSGFTSLLKLNYSIRTYLEALLPVLLYF